MKLGIRHVADVVVLDFKGDLVGGPDALRVQETVTGLLAEGRRKFLLNLDKVDFVNSSGVGIVVAAFTAIKNGGGAMKLCNANDKVSRIMVITKLLEVFDSYYKEAEALEAFKTG